jgi:DNA-binding SARP family transcriptional activator
VNELGSLRHGIEQESGSVAHAVRAGGGLRLTLLRGFQLEHDGNAVDLPLGSQRLVAFLALQRRPVERLFVAGTLWIDRTETSANASLRTALWRLQRLALPLVESTRSRLALSPLVSVDVHEANAWARRVLLHDGAIGTDTSDTLFFDGDLLSDWYDDWVLIERERVRQLRLHALETLCADLTAAGAYALAIDAGLACVAAEPLRESAHRVLIDAYRAEGNYGEAIRQYRLYERILGARLGLQPSSAMRLAVQARGARDGPVTAAR